MDNYDFEQSEKEMLDFWDQNKVYQKQKAKGKNGKKFYFLQGPPYTSGTLHIGHFWNYATIKDPILRYKKMQGFNVWDRNGWDMHGFPTSNKVTEKLGLKSHADIEKFGVAKFMEECEKWANEKADEMAKSYHKWAIWMDVENSYKPISKEYMEGIWWCIKRAHENGLLYLGDRVMPWSPELESTAAKHELEPTTVTENSIYLKMKLLGEKNTYFIVWTTTPWTIPFNLGIMANPELKYVKLNAGKEKWIVAKDRVEPFLRAIKKDYDFKEEMTGKDLEGKEYEPLLSNEVPELEKIQKKNKWAFKVVLSKEYVDTSVGTGLVHMAPGCGPEDEEVGRKHGLPSYNEVDERGYFNKTMGIFSGWKARDEDSKFTEYFDKIGVLVATEQYNHEYPFHERSHKPVIFRVTKQWFFATEKVKDKLRLWNQQVNWIPGWAGTRAFESWLEVLRDNSISRQMYWGTPLPIWVCESCKDYTVVGTLAELKKLSKKTPKNMHIPWIDEITFKCEKCGGTKKRVPDVADVWLDAGCASWNSLNYPGTDKTFKEFWPADFISEAREQVKLWFSLLFIAAAVSGLDMPFKNCYMYGMVNDSQGRKMSKSLGNYILPQEITEKYSIDAARYYFMGLSRPGVDGQYNANDVSIRQRNLGVLWNVGNWLLNFAEVNELDKFDKAPNKLGAEDRYMLSRMNSSIKKVTELYDSYRIDEVPAELEKLFLDLSRVYIKFVRDKSTLGDEEEKYAVGYCVYHTLISALKMFGTVAPFICEKMYQKLRNVFKTKEISIHLFDWPSIDEKMINPQLETDFATGLSIISSILSMRDKEKLGVRWPLRSAVVVGDEKVKYAVDGMTDTIGNMANIKEITWRKEKPEWIKMQMKINHPSLNKKFKEKVPMIVGNLVQLYPDSVRDKLEKEGKFTVSVDDVSYELTRDDVYFEEELKSGWAGMEFEGGKVYLNTSMDKELLSEGYMREIVRRIQDMRKKAKLKRSDRADAMVRSNGVLIDDLLKHKAEMQKRTGCNVSLSIGGETSATVNEILEVKEHRIFIGLKV